MGAITRFGVSIEVELLENFDKLCLEKKYQNRSEAIRDLIRKSMLDHEWSNNTGHAVATLTLIYDHHKSDLSQKLTQLQHDAHHTIIASLHVHIDHNHCLETLILKGEREEITSLADKLIAVKGVFCGQLSGTTIISTLD